MRDIWGFSGNPDRQPFTRGLEGIEQGKNKKLRIEGGTPLSGTIGDVRGGKNMLAPIIFAACLATTYMRSYIHNVPNISELAVTSSLVEAMNAAKISFRPDNSSIEIAPVPSNDSAVPTKIGKPSRISIVAAGFLLAKQGYAEIPLPGGDDLGERDITAHVEGLRALGAQVDDSIPGVLRFSAQEGLSGANIKLHSPRITATETLILAATKAKGRTVLKNTALDPEVEELISFLYQTGVNIQRLPTNEGKPSKTIVIEEAKFINGINYTLPIDRSAVVTYAVAAIATKSREGVLVKGAPEEEIRTFLSLLDEMGGGYKAVREGIWFFYKDTLYAPKRTVVSMNKPYIESDKSIGIYADWQPLISPLFLQAQDYDGDGPTLLLETAHPDRFHHLRAAKEAGADVKFFQTQEEYTGTIN